MSGKKMPRFDELRNEKREDRRLWKPKEYTTVFVSGCKNYNRGRFGYAIRWVALHHTYAETAESTISWFKISSGREACSAHYVLDKDGTLINIVKESDTAWHIGVGTANRRSIGIEIVQASSPFTEDQYLSLAYWLPIICKRNDIPPKVSPYGLGKYGNEVVNKLALKRIIKDNFRGIIFHSTISKPTCPGEMFRWDYLVELLEKQVG